MIPGVVITKGGDMSKVLALLGAALVGSTIATSAVSAPGGSATYTTRVFMKGMQVTVPSTGWKIHEDHPGEFNLASPSGSDEGTNIHFWLDPIASTPKTDVPLAGVGHSASALIKWLRGNQDFSVSTPTTRRIAGNLATSSVDLDLSAFAPQEDPGCPGPCRDYFVFKGAGYGFPYGTARGEPVRLYFATLGRGRSSHVFLISVDTPSPSAFKAILPTAENILRSIKLPARITAG
jgi:hypothetical protein